MKDEDHIYVGLKYFHNKLFADGQQFIYDEYGVKALIFKE